MAGFEPRRYFVAFLLPQRERSYDFARATSLPEFAINAFWNSLQHRPLLQRAAGKTAPRTLRPVHLS
jgi:hypothetical protein